MAPHQHLPSSTDVPHWHAGYNQPGYLPEAEPDVHASCHAAFEALADDMEVHAAATESWADPHDCDDIPCPTYGDDCPWQTAGVPAGQTHCPPVQLAPPGQTVPQAPQFRTVFSGVQTPPQQPWPSAQGGPPPQPCVQFALQVAAWELQLLRQSECVCSSL